MVCLCANIHYTTSIHSQERIARLRNHNYIGVDLFAGAGGLSLGAIMAGVDVRLAVEKDPQAAATYSCNHPNTLVLNEDIKSIHSIDIGEMPDNCSTILFGGPPCQGFSTSNQRTRSKNNPTNWLYKDFLRIARIWKPDWIVIENVRGIFDTEGGMFRDSIVNEIESMGYLCTSFVLCASHYGVPQNRSRLFIIASLHGDIVHTPKESSTYPVTVNDAIFDLPRSLEKSYHGFKSYSANPISQYAQTMRGNLVECNGHVFTNNAQYVRERYRYIPQGGNWEHIPSHMMTNYTDRSRCHSGIYRRLDQNAPSVVLGNYRKNMLIHPWEDRGLTVREAARLQSFPDWYVFRGSIGFQQQQVGNAVPPLLAKSVFMTILQMEENKK